MGGRKTYRNPIDSDLEPLPQSLSVPEILDQILPQVRDSLIYPFNVLVKIMTFWNQMNADPEPTTSSILVPEPMTSSLPVPEPLQMILHQKIRDSLLNCLMHRYDIIIIIIIIPHIHILPLKRHKKTKRIKL